ncbi:hypothetical protein JOC95_003843 [Bacillus tianshenii]|uniref:Uncharacterized protein n=1 Tax=Sutcliffiella tianshenii TaxID=1463404 RepID=A0ABS2P693_9BACI|nr:hypothetical protein [Bacillus tianshenii]MBM7621935.1 hypothetical protein [Bacillus tianshenii]
MENFNWSLFGTIILVITVTWFGSHHLTPSGDKYAGMSIVPEHHEDIPFYNGLKFKDQRYVTKGDQWQDIYQYYLNELPESGWKAEFIYSALDDDTSENDWSGFYSNWTKEGFDGVLRISASYNQVAEQTEVTFDKTPILTATKWIEDTPDQRVCIYQDPEDQGCTEITDEPTIMSIVQFINESFDWDGKAMPRIKTSLIEIGNTTVTVFYEKDQEIYFQSDKGIKRMKPDPDFFELTDLDIGE